MEHDKEKNSELDGLMLSSSPIVTLVFDESFNIIGCNREALRRFGFSSKEELLSAFKAELNKSIPRNQPSGRESVPLTQRLLFAAGNGIHEFNTELVIGGRAVLFNVFLKRAAYGDSFVILVHMTERHELDERVQLMLDATPLACAILYEGTYNFKDCNMEAVRLCGFSSKEEFIERQLEIIPKTLKDGTSGYAFLKDKVEEAYKTGKAVFTFVLNSMTGEELPVELTAVRIIHRDKYACSIYARDLRELRETEAKLHLHANLLKAVNKVATILIEVGTDEFDVAIVNSLEIVGRAAEVDRVYVWENFEQDGKLFCRQIYEWSEHVEPQQGKEFTIAFDYDSLPLWKTQILNNEPINGPVVNLPIGGREVLEAQGIKSVLILPLTLRGQIWGFIGFDDCHSEQEFSKAGEQVLQSCGALIVSAIERNKTTKSLVDTSNELKVHKRLLLVVNEVASVLIEADYDDFYKMVRYALKILGQCVESFHVAIWRNFTDDDGRLCCARQSAWLIGRSIEYDMEIITIDYETYLPNWLNTRDDMNGPLSGTTTELQNLVRGVYGSCKSLLLLPLNIHGEFWGFLSFFHHEAEYLFSRSEKNILRAGGMLTATAIMRNEATESLVEAKEKALLSAKSKSEFLSRMSHEIRTPMNAIIGMTQLAKKSGDMLKIKHCLDTVDDSSHRLLAIINDVLDMSKIDADKLELNNSEFELDDMLKHVFNVTQVKLEEKNIEFRLDLKRTCQRKLISDDLRLSQVLINLISNAVKFTPAYGKITLRIRENPIDDSHSELFIDVIDNGIGISPERIGSIFQSFEQADGTVTREFGGTGLGLAICKRIVDMMGGDISVESVRELGSKFTVRLVVELGGESAGQQPQAFKNDLKILVVDDSQESLEYLLTVLSKLSLNCDTAENGYEALGMISENIMEDKPYDVVLLDWHIQEQDGGETVLEIRRLLGGGNAIVIMVSSTDLCDFEHEAEAAGIRHFLTKPILSSDLYNMLLKITGASGQINDTAADKDWDASSYNWAGKRILLVDDNEINREIVEGILEETGVEIVSAGNGREAILIYSAAPDNFDIILMDIQMPVMDGLSAAREIRAQGSDVPIIAMTANAFKEDEDASFEAGMNGHIAKPFDLAEVFKVLTQYLQN